ncbi:MAG: hypothetical protein JXB05_29200 [Myxococcaceae bacterium]|nr:hypothetical protein [Myxococcaceae bacterium]
MNLDTRQLLIIAAHLARDGYMERDTFERRSTTISTCEGRLVTKQEHVHAYTESRARLILDGTPLAWERWRAEHYLLTMARAEVVRLEGFLRLEVELLEREIALAQQRKARGSSAPSEARA